MAGRAADLPAQEPHAPLPAKQMEPAQATGQKPAPSSPQEPPAPHSALQELAAEPVVASGEARTDKKPDDVFEATRTASQPKKRERSQEASSKSATLQKKLDEAKATDAKASKTAILQKKLDEARKSSTPKAAEEARTPEKKRDNDKTSKSPGESHQEVGEASSLKRPTAAPDAGTPDKLDRMQGAVSDLMEMQEAAKLRRQRVLEKAKGAKVQDDRAGKTPKKGKAAEEPEEAAYEAEARTPKKKRDNDKTARSPEELREAVRASLLKRPKRAPDQDAPDTR